MNCPRGSHVRRLIFVILGLIHITCSQVAMADSSDLINGCRNGEFTTYSDSFRQGQIKGEKSSRSYIIDDQDICLKGGSSKAGCKEKVFVVPGDKVIVAKSLGDWACIWYQSKKREYVGWVKKEEIEILPTADSEPLSAWVGKWSLHENEIEITRSNNNTSLQITGTAIWTGGKDRNGDPIAHTGDLDGTGIPSKNTLLLGDVADLKANAADCAATLSLLGDALVVRDNHNCGGMNVTFDGVYFR